MAIVCSFSQNKTVPSKVILLLFRIFLVSVGTCLCSIGHPTQVFAQTPNQSSPGIRPDFLAGSLLQDNNGSGALEVIALGDSLTRGIGDFTEPGLDFFTPSELRGEAGYPLRIENLTGISVSNKGVPGEEFVATGFARFIQELYRQRPDVAIIMEGSNDAFHGFSEGTYFRSMQTIINIAHASGVTPVVLALPPACCDHTRSEFYIPFYNQDLQQLSTVNNTPFADLNHAFQNTCMLGSCFLLNLPEGLHPNSVGYDVIAENVLATLLNINLFAPDGPTTLEMALQLPPGSIKTIPDPAPAASPSTAKEEAF